ncbi:MAG: hypothetical protein ACLQAS_07855 [Thermoplasmata archaeon]
MAFAVEQFLIGLAVGAAVVLGARAALGFVRARGSANAGTLDPPPGVYPDSWAGPSFGDQGRDLPSGSANRPPPRPIRSPSTPPASASGIRLESEVAVAPVEQVRLSRRILVHLFEFGRIGPDGIGRPDATQRGIGAALGAEQSALSKVLRRLAAGGAVEVARRHVYGEDRRVNVYSLTTRGEALAREFWLTQSPRARPRASARPTVSAEHRNTSEDRASELTVK